MELEGLTGIMGKLVQLVPLGQTPFLMRNLLPSALATAIIYPLGMRAQWFRDRLSGPYRPVLVLAILALVLVLLISLLNPLIYKTYEGLRLWPGWLFERLRRVQQSRVDKLWRLAECVKDSKVPKDQVKHRRLWYTLRRYPFENGVPYASHPTLLGNILATYEAYPLTRYGMDSLFYWTRIWLQLEKEKKEEIDSRWCVAEGLVSLSAVAFLGALFWSCVATLQLAGYAPKAFLLGERPVPPFVVAWVLLIGGYIFYRWSLPFHCANGELFKSVFDLYRERISAMVRVGPAEKDKWRGTWAYLQYLKIHCGNCGEYYSADRDRCPKCTYLASRSLESLGAGKIGRRTPATD